MTRIAIKPITIQDAITQSLSFVLSFISTPSTQYLDVVEGLGSFPPFYVILVVTDRVFALAVRLDPSVPSVCKYDDPVAGPPIFLDTDSSSESDIESSGKKWGSQNLGIFQAKSRS